MWRCALCASRYGDKGSTNEITNETDVWETISGHYCQKTGHSKKLRQEQERTAKNSKRSRKIRGKGSAATLSVMTWEVDNDAVVYATGEKDWIKDLKWLQGTGEYCSREDGGGLRGWKFTRKEIILTGVRSVYSR